ADAAAFAVDPHDTVRAPLQDLDDDPFLAAPAVHAGDADHDPVTVQHTTHLAGGQEDVVAAGVGTEETEAVFLAEHAAGDQVQLVGDAIAATPVHVQLAVTQHGRQALA